MRNEPSDLTPDAIAAALTRWWHIGAERVTYAQVGFGSYHWVASSAGGRWFVTADRLEAHGHIDVPDAAAVFALFEAAFRSAETLAKAGLEFVVAPLPDIVGQVLRQITPAWSMAVFPYVESEPVGPGPWQDDASCREAALLVARLHVSPPPSSLQRWSFGIPHRTQLLEAMTDLEHPWTTGLYADPTRLALTKAAPGVERLIERYDRLADELGRDDSPWVVSHGEPHSANFVRETAGVMRLIDWDTVRLAPRERDLAAFPADSIALEAYREATGGVVPRPGALSLFEDWWTLAEICEYVRRFRYPHEDGPDEQLSWQGLEGYLIDMSDLR